ncbi:transposase [Bradyrhizobium sp. USDA 4518]
MRGSDERSGSLFSYVDLEARVRVDHPLRVILDLANAALSDLSGEFGKLYTDFGRPSIAPEKLLRAMLLQAFYGVRSERHLMERIEFDLLFRWFVGLGVDDAVWDHSTFSKNRDRLLEGEIAAKFLTALLAQPKVKRLLSSDHLSVDGTLIEAWASIKSFRKNDGSDKDEDGPGRAAERSFHKEKRSKPRCIHGRATGSGDKGHSRTGLVTEMHTTKPAGDPFNDPAHAGRRRVHLTEEANLSFPACFRNRDGVFQLCDVDSDKCFPIVCHGSSSCDEDRLGTCPSNPRTRSVGRATSPGEADIRPYRRPTNCGGSPSAHAR